MSRRGGPLLSLDQIQQIMVVRLGQFDVQPAVERLYRQITLMLYRSDSDDWTPRTIARVRATPTDGGVQVTVRANDPSDLYAVLVAHTTGDGAWRSVELAQAEDETWGGNAPGR